MDNTDVEMFLTVLRTGNVTAASLALHITQSALSKRLKKLEEALGVDLFIRGKGVKGVEPTHAGIEFMQMAQRWQGLWQDMHTLRSLQGAQALNIGVLDSVQPVTVRLSRRLYERDSQMQIRFHVRPSGEMYDEIDRRTVDVGFSHLERPVPAVQRRRLFSEPFMVVRPCGVVEKEFLTPKELSPDEEVFAAWWSPGFLAWHERHWEMARSRRLCTNSVHLQRAFLGTLGTWAIVPYSVAHEFVKSGQFVMSRLDPEPPPRVCYLLWHKQTRSGVKDALVLFNDCLDQTLRDDMPWMVRPAR